MFKDIDGWRKYKGKYKMLKGKGFTEKP